MIMSLSELFLIAIGLSMDAFAVALGKGLCMKAPNYRQGLTIAVFFGGFQAGMPLLGYFMGQQLAQYIRQWDHWLAFALLSLIGCHMIREARQQEPSDPDCSFQLGLRELTVLAIATSIDALAAGLSFAFLDVHILPAVSLIGLTTLILSFGGVLVGSRFGLALKSRAETAGGLILFLIGLKIVLEHLGVI
jgi:putative Mn2+ efflux pump MntP